MQEATITRWAAAVGDRVVEGEPLVEVETDKVTDSVMAPSTGVLAEIVAQPGEVLGVGQLLGTITEDDGVKA